MSDEAVLVFLIIALPMIQLGGAMLCVYLVARGEKAARAKGKQE